MYLSDPLVSGFTTGAAFHILSSQVRHFLGLTVPRGTSSGIFGLFKVRATKAAFPLAWVKTYPG